MQFYKYQGTGNDFIIFDDRKAIFALSQKEIAHLCHRRFGIGADGLMLIQEAEGYDFRMVYYNSDGTEGTMCGNGGRCLVRFANDLGIVTDKTNFIAVDGPHLAYIDSEKIALQMQDVKEVKSMQSDYYTNTGSPHYVQFCSNVAQVNVREIGAKIRYSEAFSHQNGTNVNFVEKLDNERIFVRTYERGVEDETYSCGTGVTAAALITHIQEGYPSPVKIETLGGHLSVEFEGNLSEGFHDIFLIGPAKRVFEGNITSL